MPRLRSIVLGIIISSGFLLISTETKEVPVNEIYQGLYPILKKIGTALPVPFISDAIKLWEYFESIYQVFDGSASSMATPDQKLAILSNDVSTVKYAVYDSRRDLMHKIEDTVDLLYYRLKRDEFNRIVNEILEIYEEYIRRVESGTINLNKTREKLVSDHLDGHPDLDSRLKRMHDALYRTKLSRDDGLLQELMRRTEYHELLKCASSKSIQQTIYEFYRQIVEAEIKTFVYKMYLTSLQDAHKPQKNETAQATATRIFLEHMTAATAYMTEYMKIAPREVRRCNPRPNLEDQDYVKFGPIFQKYLMSGYDTQREWPRERHAWHIAFRDYCNIDRLKDMNSDYSNKEYGCNSFVHNCKTFTQHSEFNICPLNRTATNKKRYERYLYVESIGRYLSDTNYTVKPFDEKNKNCKKSEMTPWGEVFLDDKREDTILFRCPVNLCTCDDHDEKLLRFIDLRMVKADKDKVVTGVRIKPVNNVFHLQIQQGELMPSGLIRNATWKEIERSPTNLDRNSDFFKLRYTVTNRFYLETSEAPFKNQIVTGVGFNATEFCGNSGIRIDTLVREFDFVSGTFTANESTLSPHGDCSNYERFKKVDLENHDVPDDPKKKYDNEENRDGNHAYVDLTQTSVDIDFGQNILPFVDIQPVETFPPTPLSGVGLFRRSSENSGGYLALKLLTFDFSAVMQIPDIKWITAITPEKSIIETTCLNLNYTHTYMSVSMEDLKSELNKMAVALKETTQTKDGKLPQSGDATIQSNDSNYDLKLKSGIAEIDGMKQHLATFDKIVRGLCSKKLSK